MKQLVQLSNGVRIASVQSGGPSTALAVVTPFFQLPQNAQLPLGSFILEKAAFSATRASSSSALQKRMDTIVGGSQVKSHREYLRYASMTTPMQVEPVLQILGEIATQPLITEELLNNEMPAVIEYEVNEMKQKKPEEYMAEMILSAAYGRKLFSLRTAREDLKECNLERLNNFINNVVQPNRLCVIGAGPDPDIASRIAEAVSNCELFSIEATPQSTSPEAVSSLHYNPQPLDDCVEEDGDQPLTHVSLAYEGLPQGDPDFYVASVLCTLLGGGGAFSAGGPGKGMYSRLMTRVLNTFHYVESARAFNVSLQNTGLFGIHGSAPMSHAAALLRNLKAQLEYMSSAVSEEELARAKNMAASAQLMGTEMRFNLIDQLADSLVYQQCIKTPQELAEQIQSVQKADLDRVAQRLLSSKPVVALFGQIPSKLPSLD